jgi:spore germination cell wall hydrolase CwlJ-like protein
MHQTLIQCTAILSAVSITAVGATAKACQTSDLLFREEHIESDTIFKLNVIEKTLQSRSITSFFDINCIKLVEYQQEANLTKISSKLNTNIGLISNQDFELLCQLVAAEAENQSFEGKRAVAAVVLNRVDYGWPFEDSIEEVIFQDGQFTCISDKRFFDAWTYVSDEDQEAVAAELSERKYNEYLYFTAGKYGDYGTPAEQIGDHYFCKE